MKSSFHFSRRSFLTVAAATPFALQGAAQREIPIGLELYSVRDELKKDPKATVSAVAKMGYQVVEFYAPYYEWTPEFAREMRTVMNGAGIRCLSTHNGANSFTAEGIGKAIELNQILGSKYVVMAHPGKVAGVEGWKEVAGHLTEADAKLGAAGLHAGYHNHESEFSTIDGKHPMEILAANTPKSVMLQLDVGTCVQMNVDPVAWINANPGRIRSMHLKDYAPGEGKGFRVLFGEGAVSWPQVLDAAEKTGGVEFYLIEQEGSRLAPMETAERCLANFKKIRA